MTRASANRVASSGRTRACTFIAVAILASLVLMTFSRIVRYRYVGWDDQETIFENPSLRPIASASFINAWTQAPMAIYMPVTRTAWTMLAWIADRITPDAQTICAVPFRCFSLCLHIATSVIVFAILRRLLKGATLAALLGAAVFAIHPLQVESVAWISGQKDLLAGFFSALSIWLALRAGKATASSETELPDAAVIRKPRALFLAACWLSATLAMLAKPQAVTTPLMIASILIAAGVSWRRAIGMIVPPLMIAAIIAAIASITQTAALVDAGPIWQRPLVLLDACGWYVAKLFTPVDLAVDYGRTPGVVLFSVSAWIYAALALASAAAIFLHRRKCPLLAVGALVALTGVLPVSGLVKFDFQYVSTVTDHYAYTSMLGVALACAAVLASVNARVVYLVLGTLVAVLAILSFRQAAVWRTTDSLFAHALAVNPQSFAAHRVLAFEAASRDDDRWAVELLEQALATHPNDPIANFNLANALVRLGDNGRAESAFKLAITTSPRQANYRHNYAILLIRQGRRREAEQQLQSAVADDPTAIESARALQKLRSMMPAAR